LFFERGESNQKLGGTMNRYFTITAMLVIVLAVVASAQLQSNTKLVFNTNKQFSETNENWQVNGSMIMPNPGAMVAVTIAGPRYEVKDKWWIAVHPGILSVEKNCQSLIDIRGSLDAFDPIHIWGDVEYFPKTGNWYTYLDVNYRLPAIGLIGLETENDHFPSKKDNWGIGPRVVLPFASGRYVIISSYQFHLDNDFDDCIWVRSIFNF